MKHRATQKSKKNAKSKSPGPAGPPPLRARFRPETLRTLFVRLFQPAGLDPWLPAKKRGFYQRVFSPLVVLWYFIYLRLEDGRRLYDVVTDVHQGGADGLGSKGKPLSQRLRSWATTSFCKARQRFPLTALAQAPAGPGATNPFLGAGSPVARLGRYSPGRQYGAAAPVGRYP